MEIPCLSMLANLTGDGRFAEIERLKKYAEIAKILGISLPLTKYRLKRAKELLACYLGKEDLT